VIAGSNLFPGGTTSLGGVELLNEDRYVQAASELNGHPSNERAIPIGNGRGRAGAAAGNGNSSFLSGNFTPPSSFLQNLGGAAEFAEAEKPNILYIMADQMAAPLLKMHDANSPIRTPNIDKLAQSGVVFTSAYCNSPLCAPSRFSMCTGQLPSKIGGYDNASVLNSDVPTYAHYLRREGYETALAGKMHFIGPDQLHGFEHR
jgi:hypothetical protein